MEKKPKSLIAPLLKDEKIAFICSFCLGDNLISLVTINNLVRNGYQIDVYGDYAYALRDWFPWVKINPQIKPEQQKALAAYPTVLHMYASDLSQQMQNWHKRSFVLSDSSLYRARMLMVDIQTTICRELLQLQNVVRVNNIKPLPNLVHRKYKQRIVISPTSSLLRKNWPRTKFIKLAKILRLQGYQPHFIVAPSESATWHEITLDGFPLLISASLSNVATLIYESGYFIGNDSGIGHLASNLGIPTVSLILRKGVARQWTPSWSRAEVVMSPTWLNPRPIREKLWKYFTTVNMVLRHFKKIVNDENFVYCHNFDQHLICTAQYYTPSMQDLFANLDLYLKNSSEPFFKNNINDTTTIGTVEVSGKKLVIKRYNVKGFWHWLKKCLFKSRAMHTWENVYKLQALGIDTLTPIAVIEKRFGWLRRQSYFISAYIDGRRGCDYFGQQAKPNPNWDQVIANVTSIARKLQAAHIRHHDFQYGNFLIIGDKALLLDLDHMKVYKKDSWLFRRVFRKDIKHFLSFLESNPAAQEKFTMAFKEFLA